MTLGERIKRLRQERGWSQTQLGQKLGVHQKQISGYEREVHVPSTEVLLRMARLFDVSLDYLAFDDRPDTKPGVQIADRDLLEKLEAIDRLSEHDKTTVKAVLDTFILKNRFQQLASGEGERAAASG
jgi:transcriptional regulator with XRE-family HTH domain